MSRDRMVAAGVDAELNIAEKKALDNLARYKFHNFGYWAAWWVKLNKLSGLKRPNPFKRLVEEARNIVQGQPSGPRWSKPTILHSDPLAEEHNSDEPED